MGCASAKAGDQVVSQADLVVTDHDKNDAAFTDPKKSEDGLGCSPGDIQLEEITPGHRIEPERDALENSSQSKPENNSVPTGDDNPGAAQLQRKMDQYLGKIKDYPKKFKSDVKERRKVTDSEALKAALKLAQKHPNMFVERMHHPSTKEDSDSSMSLSQ
jgi:hypothetical protein